MQWLSKRLKKYHNLRVIFTDTHNKIAAYNAGLKDEIFDILLVASDDIVPLIPSFDCIIVDRMQKAFPNFDGVLYFLDNDNFKYELNSVPIIGKNWFQFFGYVYNENYKSFFCDRELTIVSRMLCKEYYENLKLYHQCNFL